MPQTVYSWIGSAYLLTYAALTPFWGKTSDIFGRKPVLLAANVVFFVGSLVCALANSIGILIAGRAVQGAGGGGLLVLVNITLADLTGLGTEEANRLTHAKMGNGTADAEMAAVKPDEVVVEKK